MIVFDSEEGARHAAQMIQGPEAMRPDTVTVESVEVREVSATPNPGAERRGRVGVGGATRVPGRGSGIRHGAAAVSPVIEGRLPSVVGGPA